MALYVDSSLTRRSYLLASKFQSYQAQFVGQNIRTYLSPYVARTVESKAIQTTKAIPKK